VRAGALATIPDKRLTPLNVHSVADELGLMDVMGGWANCSGTILRECGELAEDVSCRSNFAATQLRGKIVQKCHDDPRR